MAGASSKLIDDHMMMVTSAEVLPDREERGETAGEWMGQTCGIERRRWNGIG